MMTPADLMAHMRGTFEECIRLAERKNHDYAGEADALRNFRACEALGICNLETGIVVRLSDKLSRIARLMQAEAAVKDESIDDTILDAINYLAIMRSARASRKETDAR